MTPGLTLRGEVESASYCTFLLPAAYKEGRLVPGSEEVRGGGAGFTEPLAHAPHSAGAFTGVYQEQLLEGRGHGHYSS